MTTEVLVTPRTRINKESSAAAKLKAWRDSSSQGGACLSEAQLRELVSIGAFKHVGIIILWLYTLPGLSVCQANRLAYAAVAKLSCSFAVDNSSPNQKPPEAKTIGRFIV